MKRILNPVSRREFLKRSVCAACVYPLSIQSFLSLFTEESQARPRGEISLHVAMHWKNIGKKTVECRLCPNGCSIENGKRGACRVRENHDGILYSLVYSKLAAVLIDPVEKKPLYHFLPGTTAYSVATAGCNLWCKFCQNWEISQAKPEDIDSRILMPDEIGIRAKSSGCRTIAFTYNEPTVQYEYIYDASALARRHGIRTVIISNGYITHKASTDLCGRLDAVKIDLKAFSEKFYRDICGGSLKEVLRNLETVKKSGRWLEIVVLIIPSLNDSSGEIRSMARWIKSNLGPHVPVHFTRFHGMYLMKNLPPTPIETLERCREIASSEGLSYAYVGNVPGHRFENTYCHRCGRLIIQRGGFTYVNNSIRGGACPHCGTGIPGVWV